MPATLLQEESSPDAELVAQSRHGNREAFGRIVRRYQGMVAGVIYSVCGDLHRSEDLAQETFLSAWKSLSAMNDPENYPPGSARSPGTRPSTFSAPISAKKIG
jgi:Sigma-70 region 2